MLKIMHQMEIQDVSISSTKWSVIQLTEYEVGRFDLYEVKPGILRKAFWVFKLELLL